MKTSILFLSCLMALAPTLALADREGGSGTTGGGEHNGPSLRDLVDEGTCIFKGGYEFAPKEAPALQGILKRLEKTSWAFAEQLRHEIARLAFCVVRGKLKRLKTNDSGDLIHYQIASEMAAIRVRVNNRSWDTVYISGPVFRRLNSESKAFLLIHEAMHTFVPIDAEQRNKKVRNLVATVHEAINRPMSEAEFSTQVFHSDGFGLVAFDSSIDPSILAAVHKAASPSASQEERTAAYVFIMRSNLMTHINHMDELISVLRSWDIVMLMKAMIAGNKTETDQLLLRQPIGILCDGSHPAALGIGINPQPLILEAIEAKQVELLRHLTGKADLSSPACTDPYLVGHMLNTARKSGDPAVIDAVEALIKGAQPQILTQDQKEKKK